MFYLIWIPIAILYAVITAYFSFKLNSGSNCLLLAYFFNILPVFTLVSKYSTSILTDALIYDLILFVCYSATLIYLTNHKMTFSSFFGIFLMILGMIIFKKG